MRAQRKRLRNTAHDRHVVVVQTPETARKIFQVQFQRRDGSLFLHFPYFASSEGFVSCVRRNPQTGELDLHSDAAVTSHRVKFVHHSDGRAHFSLTKKVQTSVLKHAVPLDRLAAPAFLIRCQGLEDFAPTSASDRGPSTEDRTVVAARFEKPVNSVEIVGTWYERSRLLERSIQRVVGPYVAFRRGGVIETGAVIGPSPGYPPESHVLLLTVAETKSLPDVSSYLMMLGGFDPSLNFVERAASFSFLLLAYPRGAVEGIAPSLRTIDLGVPNT